MRKHKQIEDAACTIGVVSTLLIALVWAHPARPADRSYNCALSDTECLKSGGRLPSTTTTLSYPTVGIVRPGWSAWACSATECSRYMRSPEMLTSDPPQERIVTQRVPLFEPPADYVAGYCAGWRMAIEGSKRNFEIFKSRAEPALRAGDSAARVMLLEAGRWLVLPPVPEPNTTVRNYVTGEQFKCPAVQP